MIKVENVETWGFEHAIRGMRNPLASWAKSDSFDAGKNNLRQFYEGEDNTSDFIVGKNDLDLMQRLYKAGTEHRKYLRQIFVSMDIIAPDYWFKEFSTYRIGVVENSTSTMHRICAKEFTTEDFSCENLLTSGMDILLRTIKHLNECRNAYVDYENWDNNGFRKPTKKELWYDMISLLPMSYNYRRTVTMNYENVVSMIHQREHHKLSEWNEFVEILMGLPYVKEIMEKES